MEESGSRTDVNTVSYIWEPQTALCQTILVGGKISGEILSYMEI